MKEIFVRIATLVRRHPVGILAGGTILLLVCAIGLTRIQLNTAYDTFISSRSPTYQIYRAFQSAFGGDSVIVMATGSRSALLSPAGLAAQRAAATELQRNPNIRQVVSPATVIDLGVQRMAAQARALQQEQMKAGQQAVAQARLATAKAPAKVAAAAIARARQQAAAAFVAHLRARSPQAAALLQLGPITASNPAVVRAIVSPDGKTLNPLLAPLFPDASHAITQVQLKGNLALADQQNANDAIRRAFTHDHQLAGQQLTISGTPVVFGDLVPVLLTNAVLLFGLAVVLMAVVLAVVFNVRWRVLALGVVAAAVAVTLGLMGWAHLDLTMVTVAALPILLGLGVDYVVQVQNRYEEEAAQGDGRTGLARALSRIGPAVGIAVIATALGFVTLLISPVPMVRDFGLVLTGGVIIAYLASIVLLSAILVLRDRKGPAPVRAIAGGGPHVVDRVLGWLSATVIARPLPILLVALVLSVAGWMADGHIATQTDMEKLLPQNMPALQSLWQIRAVTGGTSEIDVLVTAPDVTAPQVMSWMKGYETQVRARHPGIIGVNSPVTLLAAETGGTPVGAGQARTLLLHSPGVLRDPVLTSDGHHATIAFRIKAMPLGETNGLIDQLQATAHPPAGVQATVTGTQVLAARTVSVLTDNRLQITLLGVCVVFVGLLLLYRSIRRPLLVVVPMILVIGWSEGAMYLLHQPWNPLTVTLGALIIGIGAEFTILLTERYYEERRAGRDPAGAMSLAMRRIGRAILTSGLMVMAGFSALIISDFPLLRAFGIVVGLDMAAILVATLVVLPPLVVWLETRWPRHRRALRPAA
jgi:hydrophobe/amphiphile efflux-3 (HAE3) family protein